MTLLAHSLLSTLLVLVACTAEPAFGPAARDRSSLDDLHAPSCPVVASSDTALRDDVLDFRCEPIVPDEMTTENPDPELCAEINDRARYLLVKHMRCLHDMQCTSEPTVEILEDTCVPAFACHLPVGTLMARPLFVTEAHAIDREYAQACGCPVPSCVDADYTFATCESNICTLSVDLPVAAEQTI